MKLAEVIPATIVHAFHGSCRRETKFGKFLTAYTLINDKKVYSAMQMHRQLVDQGHEGKDVQASVGLSRALCLMNAASVPEQQMSAVNNGVYYLNQDLKLHSRIP